MRFPFPRQLRPLFAFDNCCQLFLNRIFFNKTGPTVYLYKGHAILADHQLGDQDGIRSCISPGLYDPFLEMWKPASEISFLDAGANSGGFPFALFKHQISVSSGICVELNPATFRRLIYNVGPLFGGKIIPLNLALAGNSGTGTIRLGGGGVTDNIYHAKADASSSEVAVQFVTLDELMDEYFPGGLDILKIDIEGAEFEALKPLSSKSLSRCRNLLIEIHGEESRQKQLCDDLKGRGFQQQKTRRPFIEPNVFWFQREAAL